MDNHTTLDSYFEECLRLILAEGKRTHIKDITSSARGDYLEVIGATKVWTDHTRNVVKHPIRKMDMRWALAQTLWFFTGEEDGNIIAKYNDQFPRFSSASGYVVGAYGARSMQQLRLIPRILVNDPDSRRAIVTLGRAFDLINMNHNIPPCTTMMQFFLRENRLHMSVYQRSQNAWGVLPYDMFLFSHIIHWVAWSILMLRMEKGGGALAEIQVGNITVHYGSLHIPASQKDIAMDIINNPGEAYLGTVDALMADPKILNNSPIEALVAPVSFFGDDSHVGKVLSQTKEVYPWDVQALMNG